MKKEAAVSVLNSTVFLLTWKASRQSGSSHGTKGKEQLIAAEMLVQKVTKQSEFLFGTELQSKELCIVEGVWQVADVPDLQNTEKRKKKLNLTGVS